MSAPLFSIILPTFNAAATVRKAVESALSQSFEDFELLIQDGGSTDGTLDGLPSDERIKAVAEQDTGVYDAMNRALARASGEWVYILGADDRVYDPDVLKDVSARTADVDVLYGDVVSPRWEGRYNGESDALKIGDCNICHQALFVRRSLYARLGGFDPRYPVLADWHLNMRWFFDSSVQHQWVDRVIAHYGDRGLSSTQSGDGFLEEKAEMHFRLAGKRLPKDRRRHYLRKFGLRDLRGGHPLRGLRELAEYVLSR